MPTIALATKTVVAGGVLALAATGTAMAFAAPTSRPDEATARMTTAQAHRGEHAAGDAHGSTTTPTDSTTGATGTGDGSSIRSSRGEASHRTKPARPGTSSAANAHSVSAQAYGLCTAFSHGGLASGSTAYVALATAAGGADHIATYCAAIVHPGNPQGSSNTRSTGAASNTPPPHPAGKPTDPPTPPHPTGKPTDPASNA